MSYLLENPAAAAAIQKMIDAVDAEDLAEKSNAITGGCLRGEDAVKVAGMVCEAAMRQPGRAVHVAGLLATFAEGRLTLSVSGLITETLISL